MTQPTQQPPKPADAIIMAVQKDEIDRINDNRIYLLALNRELNNEAMTEIARRDSKIAALEQEIQALRAGGGDGADPQSAPQDEPHVPPTEA